MRRALPVLLLASLSSGCGQEGRAIRIANTAYYFPPQHIDAIVDPEESGSGQLYIRLIPPGDYYWLVYAPRKLRISRRHGPNAPKIPHINTHFGEIEVTQTDAGAVVCRKPVNDDSAYLRQIFNCGFRIFDNGVPWTVIIPGDLAASAPALKRRAEITLADYRRDRRARGAN